MQVSQILESKTHLTCMFDCDETKKICGEANFKSIADLEKKFGMTEKCQFDGCNENIMVDESIYCETHTTLYFKTIESIIQKRLKYSKDRRDYNRARLKLVAKISKINSQIRKFDVDSYMCKDKLDKYLLSLKGFPSD